MTNTETVKGEGKRVSYDRYVGVLPTTMKHINSIANNNHLIILLSQVFLQMLSQQSFHITFMLLKYFFLKANIQIIFYLRKPTLREMTWLNATRD